MARRKTNRKDGQQPDSAEEQASSDKVAGRGEAEAPTAALSTIINLEEAPQKPRFPIVGIGA